MIHPSREAYPVAKAVVHKTAAMPAGSAS